jgi:hypothetical protein
MKEKKDKELTKKDEIQISPEKILGGEVGNFPDARGKIDYKAEAEKVPEGERHKVVPLGNAATGSIIDYPIDRRGMTEQKLSMILADSNSSEDQKMSALSLFLFEAGKESASFLADLFMYKGQNTREVREFKSTIRGDFTKIVSALSQTLIENARFVLKEFFPKEGAEDVVREAFKWIEDEFKKNKEKILNGKRGMPSLKEYALQKLPKEIRDKLSLILFCNALRDFNAGAVINTTYWKDIEEREKAAGKGIYLGPNGKAYGQ